MKKLVLSFSLSFMSLLLFVLPICTVSTDLHAKSSGNTDVGSRVRYFKKPLRELSVILTEEGYYPNRLMAYVGEKVRFFVTSTKSKPECFVVQDHKVFMSAKKGELSEAEVIFKEAGKFKFYCPSSKHRGFITILQKSTDVEEQKRTIASEENRPSYWMPRDYDE